MKRSRLTQITQRFVQWYGVHGRDLPWRRTADPYHVWISEVMLQQTQVETVIPYYHRFLSRFPTVQHLATAAEDDVLKAWENLGYYARARHVHRAARDMVERFGGCVPSRWQDLSSLSGIGAYTAGAILSIAFGVSVPAVDGNARRVLSRLFAIQEPLDQTRTLRRIQELAESLVPHTGAGRFNQALMDVGAVVCTPKCPRCDRCPVGEFCRAKAQGQQDMIPVKGKRKPLPYRQVTAAFVRNKDGRLLIVQRPRQGLLAGLWKFPGGRRLDGESLEVCVQREVRKELGIDLQVQRAVGSIRHAYTHFRITLHAFKCRYTAGVPGALGCHDWRWVHRSCLDEFAFSRADRKIIAVFDRQ
ncbi:MAG: A/G-specific adenine glycosylase [Deltaproteobacteria bacterium]|nr:A/G-specific adenine glycosylase [Deltaproteobacteria bacterium]